MIISRLLTYLTFIGTIALAGHVFAIERSSSNYRILQDALSTGGGEAGSSTNYKSYDTAGEVGGGPLASTNYLARGNFRYLWIDPFLTFSLSNTVLGFGTLTSTDDFWANTAATGSVTEPTAGNTTSLTAATNAASGLIVAARSRGDGDGTAGNGSAGLYRSATNAYLIPAVGAASLTGGGTEGFGLYAKDNGSGAKFTISTNFDNTASDLPLTTTGQTIISTAGPIDTSNTASIYLKAAISTTSAAGNYQDTITITVTGKY